MAEKYGTIPPRFTSAWFEYVWTYYKWHILIPLFVIGFTIMTLYQCTHRVQYDAEIIYAGHRVFTDTQLQEIPEGLAKYSEDADKDGEARVFFQQINFTDKPGSEEMDYNMQMKLDLQFQSNEAYIFIFDKAEADIMIGRESAELIYAPVSEWADAMPSEDKLYTKDGTAYAVSLANNEKIKELGINTDDIYLTVRCRTDNEKYENALHIANALISE